MSAQPQQLSPLPASADSRHLGRGGPPLALSSGSAVAEKGGREVAGGGPSIKVGLHAFNFYQSRTFKRYLTEGPRAPTFGHIKSAQQPQLSLLPATADSPPSSALGPPLALSSGSAVAEKGGREVGRVPSIKNRTSSF